MLVLTRKAKQKIVINGNIVVTILSIHERAVSVGIEAPSDVKIFREELTAACDEPPELVDIEAEEVVSSTT